MKKKIQTSFGDYLNQLGEQIRAKYPELHGQPDIVENGQIYKLELLQIWGSDNELDPKYELVVEEYNENSMENYEPSTWSFLKAL